MRQCKKHDVSNGQVEGIVARLHRLAAFSAVVAVAWFLGWATSPLWLSADTLPRFQNLFLLFAAAFALLAGGSLGAAALTKRCLY